MLLAASCVVCGDDRPVDGIVCRSCSAQIDASTLAQSATWPRAVFRLDPVVRELIAALKYRRERRVATWCATRLVSQVPRAADAITWVPATPERVRGRGYDQAHELARRLAQDTGVPIVATLVRARDDSRQTGRDRQARASGPAIQPRGRFTGLIVVIDDVLTTGATMTVAENTLLGAGAQRVVGLTVARTPLRHGPGG